ncbi:MAG: threonine/serine dehydratase [Halieaceae bacterium]|jgi:threonine dehydratase|nr:threonine/serine dehydratase [Halieaceae bacterium]
MVVDAASISARVRAVINEPFYTIDGVVATPLEYSESLSNLSGCHLYLKCENLQTTGSFKIRGATSAILNLCAGDRRKGVITASSGNHGAATAMAAQAQGIPVSIYVPSSISSVKEEKITSLGARLIKVDGPGENAEREAARVARDQGLAYISPYNDVDVIAGQGTIAEEIQRELPGVDAVFVSVGGGGLISGIGAHLKTYKPQVEIVGCWPQNSPCLLECIKAGTVIEVSELETLSDGTAGGVEEGAVTLPLCKEVLSASIEVSEREIAEAMELVYRHHGYIIEGAAGVALAGLLKNPRQYAGKKVVIVLCGGNISEEKFDKAMTMLDTAQ